MPLFTACTTSPDQVTLARVDGENIRAQDLKKVFEERKSTYGPEFLSDPEGLATVKKGILNGLIERKILLQVVQDKKIALTLKEEEEILKNLKAGYSESELERVFREKGMDLGKWVEQQKEKGLIEKLIDQEIGSKAKPTDQEVQKYYKKNKGRLFEPDRIRCRHIAVNKLGKAKTILSLLKKGENFASIAQQYSESPDRENGGDLGDIARGEYPPVFDAACFTLATGQTSEVVASEYGFHIFRVVEKNPGHLLTLKEARPLIEKIMAEPLRQALLRQWLEELYRNKKITVDEKALKEVSLGPIEATPPETSPGEEP